MEQFVFSKVPFILREEVVKFANGGSMFFRNFGIHLQAHTASQPKRRPSTVHKVLYRDKLQGPAARRFLQKAVNLLTTV
jgi:hypothetical protein